MVAVVAGEGGLRHRTRGSSKGGIICSAKGRAGLKGRWLALRSATVHARLRPDHKWYTSTTWWFSGQLPLSPEQSKPDYWQANQRQGCVL